MLGNKVFYITILLLLPLCCFADDEHRTSGDDCGEHCSWKIEDGVLTLTGYGNMQNFRHHSSLEHTTPWYWNRGNITKVVIENQSDDLQFTSVGNGVFEYMDRIQEIVLPEGIKTIGSMACYGCLSLKKVNFPDSLEAIKSWAFGQAPLTEVDFPAGLKNIYDWAFQYTDLTSVVIPENAEVSEFAFFNDSRVVNSSSTPITTIYCAQSNMEQCRAAVAYRGENVSVVPYERREDGKYFVKGKFYNTFQDLSLANPIKKRIYTIEEANATVKAIGKDHVKFRIRYK